MKNIKWIILFLIVIGVLAFGIWIRDIVNTRQVQTSSTVLLEEIQKVSKVIAVEGYFSEVYDYKEYWKYDWMPLRKKALVRVKAKVSVGYDMSDMVIDVNEAARTINLSEIGEPEILSIDHDLDYYDITEGTFNAFTVEDYNKIQEETKEFIRERALNSELKTMAEEQRKALHTTIKNLAELTGWQVISGPRYAPGIEDRHK